MICFQWTILLILGLGIHSEYVFDAKITAMFLDRSVTDTSMGFDFKVFKPATEIAVEKAKKMYPHINFTIHYVGGYNSCSGPEAMPAASAAGMEVLKHGTRAFMGPVCTFLLTTVGRMASHWNIPICTAGGISSNLGDKTIFSTLIRVGYNVETVAVATFKLLQHFQWYHVCLMSDASINMEVYYKEALQHEMFEMKNEFITNIELFDSRSSDFDIAKHLKGCSEVARVFILMTSHPVVTDILTTAYHLGMGNGEFVFLARELVSKNIELGHLQEGYDVNPESQILYSLLVISVQEPKENEYTKFTQEVLKRSKEEFNISYTSKAVNMLVGASHDCVLLYASALNKTISEGQNATNGRNIVQKIVDSVSEGTSGDLYININGDREPNMVLKDFKKETRAFGNVAVYNSVTKVWKGISGASIHWPNRKAPPPDVPLCGFDGLHPNCQQNVSFPSYISVLLGTSSVMLVLAFGALAVYRKLKFEADLNDYWWKINIDDIQPETSTQQSIESVVVSDLTLSVKPKSQFQKCTVEAKSGQNEAMMERDVAVRVQKEHQTSRRVRAYIYRRTSEDHEDGSKSKISFATYKSMKVALNKMKIPQMRLTRHLLLEIREMNVGLNQHL
ncbi:atrial natriuretic peptide receptor 1-like [Tachypleus tridentatus]|uniref:atrial natriuretic peptide receptor 1-like n=1 Tax=Tachypleus tridentatus TaxID=6853 RepID=UPI003FD29AE6